MSYKGSLLPHTRVLTRGVQARAAHTLELQQRTSLQAILRQCIDDVRERRRVLGGQAAQTSRLIA